MLDSLDEAQAEGMARLFSAKGIQLDGKVFGPLARMCLVYHLIENVEERPEWFPHGRKALQEDLAKAIGSGLYMLMKGE